MTRSTATAEIAPSIEEDDEPPHVPGYRIGARLYRSGRASIYRGVREGDGTPVILKMLLHRWLTAENAARYRHEYEVLRRLRSDGIVKAYELKQEPTALALIVEDTGGIPLKEIIEAGDPSLAFDAKLEIALKTIAALRDVHAANIIHKDINPNNIVVNLKTSSLKLIDFGLATPLAREQATTAVPALLTGTLAYVAPEQTGRMNRAVDYRSDFYSLGATFYELFTGQPPFASRDPLELVHAHIARQPTPPHRLNPHIPEPVSAIVMKLLGKNAEERYQSIWSLEHDLQHCLQEWRRNGDVAPFPIDRCGVRDRFELPQKLYGRDAEIAILLSAFDAAADAVPKVLFVTGQSGIGKTSLVREVYKPITAKRGYLAAGKFDQYERNIPYSAVVAALAELIRQVLSESEERITEWRAALHEALGTSGRVLTDLLPDLELIVGEQLPLPTLGPKETQERLTAVLRRFFQAICRADHPLVLYLDDLQWADNASLALLREVLLDPQLRSFLFIASYRDNEVDAVHPVSLMRRQLQQQGVAFGQIALTPLAVEHITQLIADAFGVSERQARELAALVHSKTNGNPFFVDEFLKSLYADGLVSFDGPNRAWRWDLEAIVKAEVTDNVVEFMARNIRELPPISQRLLRLAACIGSTFEAQTLAAVAELPAADALRSLGETILRGFVVALDETYRWAGAAPEDAACSLRFRFAHDRVRQAAYEQIPQADRARIHYRIGRLLLATLGQDKSGKDLLQVVNHLNAGRSEAPAERRIELGELNLAAGRQARASGAYEAAYVYFETGLELLGPESWSAHYSLMLALNTEIAAMAPLCDKYPELERCFADVRTHARSALDKIPVYETKLVADLFRRDLQAATETGLEALRLLGVRFPVKPSALRILLSHARARLALWFNPPERLLDRERMTHPLHIAESRILLVLSDVVYWTNRDLLALTLFRFLYICARYGNSDTSPSAYAYYAMALCAGKNADKGYRFGRLALALVDKLGARNRRPWVTGMVHANVEHWKKHSRHSLAPLLETYRDALDVGDMRSAGMALMFSGFIAYHAGETLASLGPTLQSYIDTAIKSVKDWRNAGVLSLYRDAVAYLSGAGDIGYFSTTLADSDESYRRAEKYHQYTFHFFRGFLAFHFGDYANAYQSMQRARAAAHTVVGVVRFGDMYEGLSRVTIDPQLEAAARKRNRDSIRRTLARLEVFATDCPDNYLHRWQLLEAEFAGLEGNSLRAMDRYDRAIEAARSSGHVHEEALANELAARYYLERKQHKIAATYLNEARTLYVRWGAVRKVAWLDATYPRISAGAAPRSVVAATSESQTIAAANLDLPALMKALKTIAEKTVHSQILQETINVVMQFAGAEKALLLLRDAADKLLVEADADTSRADAELMKAISLEDSRRLCHTVVNYVRRTKASVVIQDAQEPQSLIPGLHNDRYIREKGVRSILCIPLAGGGDGGTELIGLLYVENNGSSHAFTEQRVETLELICLSVAGRLELSRKAITDSLTGLYNRGYFQNNLTKEFAAARRKKRPLSLVIADIDHFKQINDRFGHQAGDAVLKHVAKALKASCRESDIVARYGGEEMVVVLPETGVEQAAEVAERIRRMLEEQSYSADGEIIPATASFGVAAMQPQQDSAEALIEAADGALYESKRKGRNRITVA